MKIFYSLLSFALLLLSGCKEQDLALYNETESGNSVYFTLPYNTALQAVPTDSLHVKFGFLPANTSSTIEQIVVAATGPLHDQDREFKILTDPSATLTIGQHYKFLEDKLVIPAGQRTGTIKLAIQKTADMNTHTFATSFQLVPNQNFNTDIKFRKTPNLQKDIPILKIRIMADNIFDKPYCWSVAPYKGSFERSLGEYSLAKLNLLIELFDEDMEHFTNPQYAKDSYFTISRMTFWASYMKYWLGREATEGRIHKDENGKVITMGPYAN